MEEGSVTERSFHLAPAPASWKKSSKEEMDASRSQETGERATGPAASWVIAGRFEEL
ncbi:hypothetical protein GCM10009696_06190 [Kocuria himachalensis]